MPLLCVFCGSQTGLNPQYAEAATELGAALVANGWGLVYGGGSVGLMGVLADAVLAHGGEVVGVIPEMLATKELLHPRVSPMHVVPSMHARKLLMADLADAFVALPGGYGTFEELFEAITWAQLGIHRKPIGLLNVGHFFDPLTELVQHSIAEGFIRPEHLSLIVVESDVSQLLARLATHQLPSLPKWVDREET